MGSPGTPKPPPEADLIRLARQARGFSPEEAAERTPIRIKGFRWRQIEKGFKGKVGESERVIGLPKTIAHMAYTVGVAPSRLIEAGREDAAQILREIQIQHAGQGGLPDPLDALEPERQRIIVDMLGQLAPRDRGPALRRLAERVEAGELGEAGAPPAEPPASPSPPEGQASRTGT
ncbi:hypothetical protein ACIQAC_01475 [Streptomyces sp. NPDC088387]|uniref:hypothetical protein n=1 Tax=Streptomyces sp. NPDC088387 TaxID=3365859 RepID=UPI003813E539